MLTLKQLNILRGITTTNSNPATSVAQIEKNKKQNVNNNLGIDESILNKLDPKWRKLLKYHEDIDMSNFINENTVYDDFGMPVIDFDDKNNEGIPNISQFGLSE